MNSEQLSVNSEQLAVSGDPPQVSRYAESEVSRLRPTLGDVGLRSRAPRCGRYVVVWLAMLLALVVFVAPVAAQNYFFSVPELRMEVFVQPDSTVDIVYDITFENGAFAHEIDIVDIGTPHAGYSIGNMSASIDGNPLTDIRRSEFVDPGVEVHLREHAIPAGGRGTLHFEFTMPDLIYQDTTNKELASLQITPTWFGSEFVSGASDIWIVIHMLPGIAPEEMLYQETPFTNLALLDDHTIAAWRFENSQATGPHLVGISFPQRGLSHVVKQNLLQLAGKWLEDNPGTRFGLGLVYIALFGFLFFRFSGFTGISVFVILTGGLIFMFVASPIAHLLAFIPLPILIFLNERHLKRIKHKYLPAVAQVEGGGIKRGLTAPEAAVLLEMPLNKVLTLVIFGLLKKGAARQVQAAPLVVEVVDELRTKGAALNPGLRAAHRNRAAQKKGLVLHKYEQPFINLLEDNPGKPVHKIDFSKPTKRLIERVAARIKDFDLSDTQDYYRSIIKRALHQAQSMGEIPAREQVIDRELEWILMDDDYGRGVFETRGYSYRPIWVRTIGHGARPSAPAPTRTSAPGGRTSFGDVAAGFAGWTESTMGNMASAIMPGSLQINTPRTGVIDLRGVDRTTGNILKALAEASASSGGGGSGGCACAGCACACACAGGGR